MDVPFNFKFPTDFVDLPSSCDSFGSSANASLQGGYVGSGSGPGYGLNQSLANITVRYELFLRVYVKTRELNTTGHDVKLVDFLAPLRFQGSFIPEQPESPDEPQSQLGFDESVQDSVSKNVNETIIEEPDEEVSLDIQYQPTSTPTSPEYPVSPVTMRSSTARATSTAITSATSTTTPMVLAPPTFPKLRNNSDSSLASASTQSSNGFSFASQSTQAMFKVNGEKLPPLPLPHDQKPQLPQPVSKNLVSSPPLTSIPTQPRSKLLASSRPLISSKAQASPSTIYINSNRLNGNKFHNNNNNSSNKNIKNNSNGTLSHAVKKLNGGSMKLKKLRSSFGSLHRHSNSNSSSNNHIIINHTTLNNNNKRVSSAPTTTSRLSTTSSIYSTTAPLNIPSVKQSPPQQFQQPQQSQQSQQPSQKLQRPRFAYLPSCDSVAEQTEDDQIEYQQPPQPQQPQQKIQRPHFAYLPVIPQTETEDDEIELSANASAEITTSGQDDDLSTLGNHPFLSNDSDSDSSDSDSDADSELGSELDCNSQYDYDEGETEVEVKANEVNVETKSISNDSDSDFDDADDSFVKPPSVTPGLNIRINCSMI
ncbi:unnamed protein product [Ambrosiozyma monospora]|uniref:Unnamed protein product n=1 Tax=Ambrosiozyma monospora TaxID=43982 RepID=A0ACB5T376_AMBMO|nr:unnamed protein product [Ambrosiozyma monospora]